MTLDDIWTQNGDGRYVNLVPVRNRYRYNPKIFPKGTCFVKSAERTMFEAIQSGPTSATDTIVRLVQKVEDYEKDI